MIPEDFASVHELPFNYNGKIDRQKLLSIA